MAVHVHADSDRARDADSGVGSTPGAKLDTKSVTNALRGVSAAAAAPMQMVRGSVMEDAMDSGLATRQALR